MSIQVPVTDPENPNVIVGKLTTTYNVGEWIANQLSRKVPIGLTGEWTFDNEQRPELHAVSIQVVQSPTLMLVAKKPRREKLEHWAVHCWVNHQRVLSLESNSLSGKDLSVEDEEVIREMANCLLGFLGQRNNQTVEVASTGTTRRIDNEGRDVTDLPGLWDEADKQG